MGTFFEWLDQFDKFILSYPGFKVLLLLENFSGHGSIGCLPSLQAVKVHFLPGNTKSKLQPLDTGIIECLKKRYRIAQYNRALDAQLNYSSDLYKIDQLTAMKYVTSLWEELTSSGIRNSWRNMGLLFHDVPMTPGHTSSNDRSDDRALASALTTSVGGVSRISIQKLLNVDDVGILEDISEGENAQAILDEIRGVQEVPENDEEDPGPSIPPLSENAKALSVVIEACEGQEQINLPLISQLRSMRRAVDSHLNQGLRQFTIDIFFRK